MLTSVHLKARRGAIKVQRLRRTLGPISGAPRAGRCPSGNDRDTRIPFLVYLIHGVRLVHMGLKLRDSADESTVRANPFSPTATVLGQDRAPVGEHPREEGETA